MPRPLYTICDKIEIPRAHACTKGAARDAHTHTHYNNNNRRQQRRRRQSKGTLRLCRCQVKWQPPPAARETRPVWGTAAAAANRKLKACHTDSVCVCVCRLCVVTFNEVSHAKVG